MKIQTSSYQGHRFDAPRATLYADVEATVNQLCAEGATDLEPVNT